jgi:phage-related protein
MWASGQSSQFLSIFVDFRSFVPILVHIPERRYPLPRTVRFFRTETGSEPIRDWIKEHSKDEMKLIGEDIRTVQFSEQWKAPLVKYLGNGLYEIRTNLFYTTSRVFFFVEGGEMILVHGLSKKTQKTPKADLALALKRKAEYEKAAKSPPRH